MELNRTAVWKLTTVVLAVLAVVSYGFPVKVNHSQMEMGESPLQIVKPVLASELYPKFTCACCGQPLNKEEPCCGGMIQIIDFIDKQVGSGLSEAEVMLSTVKEFGLDRLTEAADQDAIRVQLAAAAPDDAPDLVIEESDRDLGEVSRARGKISTDFEISNQGQSALVIDKLSSSCGCTSATIVYQDEEGPEFTMPGHGKENPTDWQVSIASGDTAILRVYYDPTVHPDLVGAVTRTVSVFSNDPVEFEQKVIIALEQTP